MVIFFFSQLAIPPYPTELQHILAVIGTTKDQTDSLIVFGKENPSDAFLTGHELLLEESESLEFSPHCIMELTDNDGVSSAPPREFALTHKNAYVVLTCASKGYAQLFDLEKCETAWERMVDHCDHLVCHR